jgi:hypothetical protein
MKHLILLIFPAIIFSFTSYSQETDARMVLADSLKSCEEIQYAVMQLAPLYYQDGKIDTARLLLDYWGNRCGIDETNYRTRVLWAIDTGTFSDTLIDNTTINHLDLYQWFATDTSGQILETYNYYTPYTPDPGLLTWYHSFTDSIARRALGYPDLSAEERFFAEFYLHPSDSMYTLLESDDLKDTKLARLYHQPVAGELTDWLYHMAAAAGVWIPYDKLTKVGAHPTIGGYAGVRHNRMIYNLGLGIAVGRSLNNYNVFYNDSLYSSDNFMGINIALEAGRQLISWRRHELELLCGLDLGMMEVLSLTNNPDDKNDDESRFLKSPSMHLGASYRYYLKNERYFGLSSRYQFLNFNNKGGTNLRGNALTITIEYGIGTNPWINKKNTFLKQRIPKSN